MEKGSIELPNQAVDIAHWESHGRMEGQIQSTDRLLQKIDGYFTENGIATQVAINKNKISWLTKFVWGLFAIFMTGILSGGAAVAISKLWP